MGYWRLRTSFVYGAVVGFVFGVLRRVAAMALVEGKGVEYTLPFYRIILQGCATALVVGLLFVAAASIRNRLLAAG